MMKSLKANGGFVNLKDDDGEEEKHAEPAEDCCEQVKVWLESSASAVAVLSSMGSKPDD